jgi:hypothetical protein
MHGYYNQNMEGKTRIESEPQAKGFKYHIKEVNPNIVKFEIHVLTPNKLSQLKMLELRNFKPATTHAQAIYIYIYI